VNVASKAFSLRDSADASCRKRKTKAAGSNKGYNWHVELMPLSLCRADTSWKNDKRKRQEEGSRQQPWQSVGQAACLVCCVALLLARQCRRQLQDKGQKQEAGS
jgi:hypothetical protein